jgi:hypothetical protein
MVDGIKPLLKNKNITLPILYNRYGVYRYHG